MFNKPSHTTLYFSKKIWVKCPKCDDIGLVEILFDKHNIYVIYGKIKFY